MKFDLEELASMDVVRGPEADAEDAGIDTALCYGCTPPEELIKPMRQQCELGLARRLGFIFKYMHDNPQRYEQ